MTGLQFIHFIGLRVEGFKLGNLVGEQCFSRVSFLGFTRQSGVLLLQYPPALRRLADLDNQRLATRVGV